MIRQWWILIREKKEGPLTLKELKGHPSLFPETLVWKKGWPKWVPAREVHELRDLFHEPKQSPQSSSKEKKREFAEILVARGAGPNLFWLLFIILIVIAYTLYRLLIK